MPNEINNSGDTLRKVEFYIVSLWLLFFLVIVVTIDIPICFSTNCSFIGFKSLFLRNVTPSISILFIFIGFLCYRTLKHDLRSSLKNPITVTCVENINYEHLTFLTTYIVPLVCFDLSKTRYVAVMAILLVVIGAIYVKTNLFYANPSLALLGYQIYKVKGKFAGNEESEVVVITRQKLVSSDRIQYLMLDDRTYYARKAE
ncbi:MAG: hypothetical protein EOM12_14380 [Verrucomicrobiae bacterium]|nr:hypothetical protein [Verrucomicrobiae bacterium]